MGKNCLNCANALSSHKILGHHAANQAVCRYAKYQTRFVQTPCDKPARFERADDDAILRRQTALGHWIKDNPDGKTS